MNFETSKKLFAETLQSGMLLNIVMCGDPIKRLLFYLVAAAYKMIHQGSICLRKSSEESKKAFQLVFYVLIVK